MKQAREKLAHLSSDPATRELLRMREKAEWDWQSMLEESHESGLAKGRQEGEAIGEAKGRQEGEAKGRQEGEAKGRQEGEAKASLQILITLLKTPSFAAMSDEEIATLTSTPLALVREARRYR